MFGVEEVVSGAELLIVALAALLGSTITAIAGLGGGILLLSVLLQFLDPLEAIPVHAVIQLASNSSRALILRRDVDWGIVARFSLFLLPAGAIGLLVATAFPVNLGRIFIAVFALALVWWPQGLTKISSFLGGGRRSFVPLGAVAGFLNIPFRGDRSGHRTDVQTRTSGSNRNGRDLRYGSNLRPSCQDRAFRR